MAGHLVVEIPSILDRGMLNDRGYVQSSGGRRCFIGEIHLKILI